MQHFPIVQALCRVAMSNPTPALKKQIERLRDALRQSGDSKEASALSSLLTTADRAEEMAPSRLTKSTAVVAGEALSRNTALPVDRETATPLAQIVFPNQISNEAPLFNDDVAGAIQNLLEEWSHLEKFEAIDVKPAKTCLIYGAPGTGKTRLAMWMARQLDLPVVVARLDSLVSSFLGTSSRNIGNLFTFANRYRCLLLLDEFDSLAKLRDDPQEVGEIKRIVNALLQNLDTRQSVGFTVGITNHPQLLDSAVWRRFEIQLEIPRPNMNMRLEMARHFMIPLDAPESHLKFFAWFTEGATGSEMEILVRSYKKLRAVRDDEPYELLDIFKRSSTLNSGRLSGSRRELLDKPFDLIEALRSEEKVQFSQADLGEILGKDKSTISRMLSARRQGRENG